MKLRKFFFTGENICHISINKDLSTDKSFIIVDPSRDYQIVYPSAKKPAVIELSSKSKDGFLVYCEQAGYSNGRIKLGNQTWSTNAFNIFCHKDTRIYVGKSRSRSHDIKTISCTHEMQPRIRPIAPTANDRECHEIYYDVHMKPIGVLRVCFAQFFLYWHAEATIQPSINRRNKPRRSNPVKDLIYQYFQTDLENKTFMGVWGVRFQFRRVAEFLGNFYLAQEYINNTCKNHFYYCFIS